MVATSFAGICPSLSLSHFICIPSLAFVPLSVLKKSRENYSDCPDQKCQVNCTNGSREITATLILRELFFQPCHTSHIYTLAFTYTVSRVKLIQFAHLCVCVCVCSKCQVKIELLRVKRGEKKRTATAIEYEIENTTYLLGLAVLL